MDARKPDSFHTISVPLGASLEILAGFLRSSNYLQELRGGHFARGRMALRLLCLYVAFARDESLSRVRCVAPYGALLPLRADGETA